MPSMEAAMIEWKKICCAVDFEDPSRVAMEQAAELARRFEAELTLVHVFVPPQRAATEIIVPPPDLASVEAAGAMEVLAGWRADAERRSGRPVRSRILSGDAAAQLLRYVREERCDVLVVGTHGRTGMSRLVLGSVAERVARRCPCPVVIVHDRHELERESEAEEIAQYR